jgi:hypothetical protein
MENTKFGTLFFFTTHASNANEEKPGNEAVFRIFDPEFPCTATKAKTTGYF